MNCEQNNIGTEEQDHWSIVKMLQYHIPQSISSSFSWKNHKIYYVRGSPLSCRRPAKTWPDTDCNWRAASVWLQEKLFIFPINGSHHFALSIEPHPVSFLAQPEVKLIHVISPHLFLRQQTLGNILCETSQSLSLKKSSTSFFFFF